MRTVRICALLALALAIASPASAGDKPSGAASAKAENKVEKAGAKAEKAAEKAADKAADKADKAADKAKDEKDEKKPELKSDKDAVKKKAKEERDELKGKVQKALKGKGMHPALKEELKRHARRLARLERVLALAEDDKDDETAARAKKLIEKENARHDKFMSSFDPEKGGAK